MGQYLTQVWADYLSTPLLVQVISAAASIVLIMVLMRVLRRVITEHIANADMRYRVGKAVVISGYIVIVLVLAMIFSDRLRGISLTLGVAGAGVAFALQEVIASAAGWGAIVFGRFFAVGDRVRLGGIMGDVIDIGVLRTTIMECGEWISGDQYNGRIVRVANSFVFKEPVYNYSADFPFLWDEIKLPIRYDSDRARARQLLLDTAEEVVGDYAARADRRWQKMLGAYRVEPVPVTSQVFMAATDNWVELTLRYVVDYKRRRATRDEIFTRVLDAIDATQGEVTVASTTLHVVGAPALEVGLRQPKDQ